MSASANAERSALEWRALQLFCAHFGDRPSLERLGLFLLKEGDFRDSVHRAVFVEISRFHAHRVPFDQLRQRLAEAMTRLGWPDLDFDSLFAPTTPTDLKLLLRSG